MAQMGFFDLSDRYASLDAKRDPLVEIDAIVPWDEFRPTIERVWRKPDAARKSRAGRKPMDAVLMFKTLVLSALYNLSDDQIEYQVRDRVPEDWADKPGKSHCGYKNHVNVERPHKLIRRYHVSDAAVHDSQAVDALLTRGSTGSGVWADAAYRSAEIAQANNMGGTLVRTIGLARAKARIGMKNLACNMRRLGQLGRLNPCPA